MQNENAIFNEIAALFNNSENIRNDFLEGYGLMVEHMHKKYVNKMKKAIEKCERNAASSPCAEVELIKAIKPFAPIESHEKLDSIVSAIQKYNTFIDLNKKLNGEDGAERIFVQTPKTAAQINAVSYNGGSECVHADGVYEIDKNCVAEKSADIGNFSNIAGMFMISALTQGAFGSMQKR